MDYASCLEYLYTQLPQYQIIGAGAYKPGLHNIEVLDAWCGHPHECFPCVHVAGTNGKGSVTSLLASTLQEAGYKVGLFTSPHLKDFRERIRINGQMIDEASVCHFTEDFIATKLDIHASFFELTTMMAFRYFAQEKVDIAIIEVGLGGRLDSTNIIRPILSVITSISFDHMALLGDTLPQIAREKAGIIKAGVPVVVGENSPEVMETLRAEACLRHAPLCSSLGEHRYSKLADNIDCALKANYARQNIRTALMALDILSESFRIDEQSIRRGFANVVRNTGLRGRWEVLQTQPLCICDTGHNEDGIRHVVQQMRQCPHKELHIVFGVVSDKDVRHILALLPKEAHYYFTRAKVTRALPETELAKLAADFQLQGKCYTTVDEAKQAALQAAGPDDLVFIGGSNFVVAEVI